MGKLLGMWPALLTAQGALIDSLYGLGELRLETMEAAFAPSQLIPKGTFQRKVWYRWAVDTSWMGTSLGEVQLAFYRKKLHTIELRVTKPSDAEALLVLLELHFGKGKQDGYAPRYRWQGQRAQLLYDQNLLTKVTTIRLESLVLQKQLERDMYKDYQGR
jgi:hypothetical protein